MTNHRRTAIVTSAIVAMTVLVVGYVTDRARGDAPATVLSTVDARLLEETNQIRLQVPTKAQMATVTVSESSARAVAEKTEPSNDTLETKLVILHGPVPYAEGCVCWAVSQYPREGKFWYSMPMGYSQPVMTDLYFVSFVDAASGQLLFSARGGREVSPPVFSEEKLAPNTSTPIGPPGPGREK